MTFVLLALTAVAQVEGVSQSLHVRQQVFPRTVLLGDLVFLKISAVNAGTRPAKVIAPCLLEAGTLTVEVVDDEEFTRFHVIPDGCPGAGDLGELLLQPGEEGIVARAMLRLPRLDWTRWRFWNPKAWRADDYDLNVRCGQLRARVTVYIDRRPDEEMDALLEYYDGGFRAPVPRDWDTNRPTLGWFGLLSFPLGCSRPDKLAGLEKLLSAGTLRDSVHATRLSHAVYDAKDLDERRKATAEFVQWLDALPEIQRQWMASQAIAWGRGNKGLGEYALEFVDRVIPSLPKDSQSKSQNANDELRRRYEKLREK